MVKYGKGRLATDDNIIRRRKDSVAQLVEALPYKRVRFPMVSLQFFIDIFLPAALRSPGVDSVSNRNEYHEYFLGVKAVSV